MSKRNTPRTRGNLKPASSTKASATLLNQGISPFSLFSGKRELRLKKRKFKPDDSPVVGEGTVLNGTDEFGLEGEIDGDLRVILKKLTKKDSTTKIRAFDELRGYCEDQEADDKIRSILPFFISHYRKWSMDSDQRVRDECQQTFDLIGMRMKKNLSPHLKTILPSWLMAQCDSYAPAASKAKFLYSKLFNGTNKQAEAVYFARNEIMTTLTDEIDLCSNALKDRKQNEMETDDAHERRLTQSLLALALFVDYFEPSKRKDLHEHFKTIFDQGKFWKLDKIQSIQIRSSFYRCLHSLINTIVEVMNEYKSKIIPLIFYSINETEPKLCPLIWDCLILCLDKFDDCWTFVHFQKAFLPKFYAFLRSACQGNGLSVKDHFLPVISKIPRSIYVEASSYRFIDQFLQSFEEGILSMKGRHQMTNISCLVRAYLDCLIYILNNYSKDHLTLLNERLLPLIRISLTEKECSIRNVFARQYVNLLNCLKSTEIYEKHLESLVDLFETLTKSSFVDHEDSKNFFEQSEYLFETILFPAKVKSLRFASSETELDYATGETNAPSNDENRREAQRIELIARVCRICSNFSSEQSFRVFANLLNASNSNFNSIVAKLSTLKNENQMSVPESFYFEIARPFIQTAIERRSSLDQTVELTIKVLDRFQSDEFLVERVLADLIQLEASRRFYFLLTSIVCRYETSPSFHSWLQKNGVLERLLNMTACVSKSTETNDFNFPVSNEEFQLLSSLLSSTKPTQYLTDIQKEQIVYLACHLLEEQSPSLNELSQSIDLVGKHLFVKIDENFHCDSTRKLIELYIRRDIECVARKNFDDSLQYRSIWFLAMENSRTTRSELDEFVSKILLSFIPDQYDNDGFIDNFISILSEQSSLVEILREKLRQKISLDTNLQRQSLFVPIVDGWILPSDEFDFAARTKIPNESERFIDVHFLGLLTIRQFELNCFLWSNEEIIRDLILNYYLFQSNCIPVKQIESIFERLFPRNNFSLCLNILDNFSVNDRLKFNVDLMTYHLCAQMKERFVELNHRDEMLDYTIILSNNDDLNLQLFLAGFFRESQLKLILPHLIELCQDERRSSLTLAALHQCLLRMTKINMIIDEPTFEQIISILMQSSMESKFVREFVQLWNSFLNHGNVIEQLQAEHWDHLLCFVGDLFTALTKVENRSEVSSKFNNEFLFLHSSNLLTTVGKFLIDIQNHNNTQLLEEWIVVFSKDIYQGLLPVYISLSNVLGEFSSFYLTNELVKSISSAICTIPSEYLQSNNLKPLLNSDDHRSSLDESTQTVFNHLYRLLSLTSNRSLQYSAYHLLNKLLPVLSKNLITQNSQEENISEDNNTCCLPGSMIEALNRTDEIIRQMLMENDIVEEHLLDEHGHLMVSLTSPTVVNREKEHMIIGDLLNYKLLLNLISCYDNPEQRYTYTLMLQQKKLVDRFLSIALSLIPANPVYNDPTSMQMSSLTKKLSNTKSMFEHDIQLNPKGSLNSPYTIHHLACSVYLQCLSLIPALVREWYHNQARRIRDAVDRMTQKYVSPLLIQQELDAVFANKTNTAGDTGTFTVKKHSTTREITAVYTIETSRVEICIRLPPNYPLGVATIECTNHVGFTKDQWNHWMLQLKTNLIQNNGAILDGLLHWKKNVDKKMQGIEECSVCYCILHTNNELPKRTCRTCKKKFHDACLFRWFRSSNKSTCPHCRANF